MGAVIVFSKDAVNGCWKWGEHSLPKVSSYSYLGIDFSSNGAWDMMVFSKDAVNGCWKWGEHSLPKVSSYSYLGIDFSSNGAWDMHIKK